VVPQALALGPRGEFSAPFTITAIGGIFVSTILTLFIIPVLYVTTAPKKFKKKRGALFYAPPFGCVIMGYI